MNYQLNKSQGVNGIDQSQIQWFTVQIGIQAVNDLNPGVMSHNIYLHMVLKPWLSSLSVCH